MYGGGGNEKSLAVLEKKCVRIRIHCPQRTAPILLSLDFRLDFYITN